jgi:hypothetical protein
MVTLPLVHTADDVLDIVRRWPGLQLTTIAKAKANGLDLSPAIADLVQRRLVQRDSSGGWWPCLRRDA